MGGWINGLMDRCHNKTVWKVQKKERPTLPGAGGKQRFPVAAVPFEVILEDWIGVAKQTEGDRHTRQGQEQMQAQV